MWHGQIAEWSSASSWLTCDWICYSCLPVYDPACLWPVSGSLSAHCDLGLYCGTCFLPFDLVPCCPSVNWPLLVSWHCLCLMLRYLRLLLTLVFILPEAVPIFWFGTSLLGCWWPSAYVLSPCSCLLIGCCPVSCIWFLFSSISTRYVTFCLKSDTAIV